MSATDRTPLSGPYRRVTGAVVLRDDASYVGLDGRDVDALVELALAGCRSWRADRVPLPRRTEWVLALLSGAERHQTSPSVGHHEAVTDPRENGHAVGLLDTDGAAAALGVSQTTVRALVRSGELPAVRIGRAVRFRPEDLEVFVEANRGT